MGIHVPCIDGTSPKLTGMFSPFTVVPGIQLKLSGWVANNFTHCCKPGFTTKYYLADTIFLISKMKES